MPRRSDGLETRKKILEAAAQLFAANGFKQTKNIEISKLSKVNSALISYYFGDKESIYREAWEFSCEKSLEKYPLNFNSSDVKSNEEKLYIIIENSIRRYMDVTCYDIGIFQQEVASITGILDDVHEKTILLLREALIGVVSKILCKHENSDIVRQCVLSIVAMCIVSIQKIQKIEMATDPYQYDVERRIKHIYRFSMCALNGIMKEIDE